MIATEFVIRDAALSDVPELARTHLATWLGAYRGVVDPAWLDSLTLEQFEGYHRPRLSERGADPAEPFLVATPPRGEGRVLGFARAGPTRQKTPTGDPLPVDLAPMFTSELYAIYVDPPAQGAGIGKALFAELTRRLLDRGHSAMCLWVLSNNAQARRFYERAGGRLVGESSITLGGTAYPQVAYGWDRLEWIGQRLTDHAQSGG
jgi:ribosomal protein S18 acetylase RimI-like enzyme